jgi:hypothetical protein
MRDLAAAKLEQGFRRARDGRTAVHEDAVGVEDEGADAVERGSEIVGHLPDGMVAPRH